MAPEQLIVCGGLKTPASAAGRAPLHLNLWGDSANVRLEIEDLHRTLYRDLPAELEDLVEIATYVYCADQATRRSGQDTDTFGAKWRRSFRFVVPVRRPSFWNTPDVRDRLQRMLEFLSDDFYQFEFVAAKNPTAFQHYLDFGQTVAAASPIDQVVMFSGGLDSLAGAIDEVKNQRRNVVLVTHLPTAKNSSFLRELGEGLRGLAASNAPLHVNVRVNKDKELGTEYTQRTRSFLFAALGFTVARMVGTNNLRFYENGVVSLNLPVCAQVIGGRATRTTHPRVLVEMSGLFSLIANGPFQLTNPFIWSTKAEVIKRIVDAGAGSLIATSISCAHTWERTLEHTHCGGCSQCIDRRFAIIAAGLEHLDPLSHYKTEIFTQARSKDEDRIMLAAYVERARALHRIKQPSELISAYPVAARAFKYLEGTAANVAQRILDLHHRHATEIERALATQVSRHAVDLVGHKLPGDCLIRIAIDPRAATAPPTTPTQPANLFVCRGNVWEMAFNGRPEILIQKHLKGCAYLQVLLQNPGREYSIAELVSAAGVATYDAVLNGQVSNDDLKHGFGFSMGIPLTNAGDTFDRKALENIRATLASLREDLQEAKANGNETEQARIEREIDAIVAHTKRAVGRGGHPRKVNDLRKRQRDAVRNSIERTLDEISNRETVLGAYLRKAVRFGATSGYFPEESMSWVTVPRVRLSA